jgi:2-keto-4-pentenoate hydratase/2-oxohepta-3-ene-1,7-dioic acid hydratase in catechol pathway
MRLATILDDGRPAVALVRDGRCLPVAGTVAASMRAVAAGGAEALGRILDWAEDRHAADWRSLDGVHLGPAVPDPGAIYTVGSNYRSPGEAGGSGPGRPLVYGKAASSVAGHGGTLAGDRALTANVDAECELGVVVGRTASAVAVGDALESVFGYTIVNDVSSRDPWLDGDQWLLGKSMPGFCPVGPWVVTPDELGTGPLRLGCTISGDPIQDGTTADLRFGIAEVIAYLSRHAILRPGDLIATGTPARLTDPPGPDRHLEPGDVVTAWIEGIGELTTTIA